LCQLVCTRARPQVIEPDLCGVHRGASLNQLGIARARKQIVQLGLGALDRCTRSGKILHIWVPEQRCQIRLLDAQALAGVLHSAREFITVQLDQDLSSIHCIAYLDVDLLDSPRTRNSELGLCLGEQTPARAGARRKVTDECGDNILSGYLVLARDALSDGGTAP
jgi:hypothetical protein